MTRILISDSDSITRWTQLCRLSLSSFNLFDKLRSLHSLCPGLENMNRTIEVILDLVFVEWQHFSLLDVDVDYSNQADD